MKPLVIEGKRLELLYLQRSGGTLCDGIRVGKHGHISLARNLWEALGSPASVAFWLGDGMLAISPDAGPFSRAVREGASKSGPVCVSAKALVGLLPKLLEAKEWLAELSETDEGELVVLVWLDLDASVKHKMMKEGRR